MKTRKFIATLIVCITLLMSVVSFSNKSYAKISEDKEYCVPESPFEHNSKFSIDEYAQLSTANESIVKHLYNVTEEMVNEKKAILASHITKTPMAMDPGVSSKVDATQSSIYKGSQIVKEIKGIFCEALSCNEDDIIIQNTIYCPAITEINIKEMEPYTITSETEENETRDFVERLANREISIHKAYKDGLEKNIEQMLAKMKGDIETPDNAPINYKKNPMSLVGHCHYLVFESKVIVKNSRTYSLVFSKDSKDDKNVAFYYVYRDDLEEKKPTFATSLDYESIEGTEVKKKATSAEENPFLPYYTDNDNNKKDTDAIAYIRSKTDEKIVSVDGVELKADGRENEKGWYYPDITNQKVVAKKYLFDTYNNKNDNGKVNEKVEVVGENGGKSQENPNIEWTFRRKIKEEEAKSDGSKVITITFNLPIDESRVEEGWSTIRDDDGAVRKITRTFKNNEGYDKEVPTYQNGTGKEVKTPVKLTAPVISKTGETTFFIVSLIVIASAVVVVAKRKIK